MRVRKYNSYADYVAHQSQKINVIYKDHIKNSASYIKEYRVFFKAILENSGVKNREGKIICLGARLGEEVEAWRRLGFDAIGIDLNPGPNNKLVIKGDFHNIPFKNESFDYVFSNSLDHLLYIKLFNDECYRVLKENGKAFFEVRPHGEESVTEERKWSGIWAGNPWYESFYWETQKELIDIFKNFNIWKSVDYYNMAVLIIKHKKRWQLPRPIIVLTK